MEPIRAGRFNRLNFVFQAAKVRGENRRSDFQRGSFRSPFSFERRKSRPYGPDGASAMIITCPEPSGWPRKGRSRAGLLQLKLIAVPSQKVFDDIVHSRPAESTGGINQDPARLQVSDNSTENLLASRLSLCNVACVSLPFDFGMGAKRAETAARRVDKNTVEVSRGET